MTELPTEGIFEIGDKVEKLKGYKLPGVIVSKFYTLSGKIRYVVECQVPEVAGLLHIYSDKDLSIRMDD